MPGSGRCPGHGVAVVDGVAGRVVDRQRRQTLHHRRRWQRYDVDTPADRGGATGHQILGGEITVGKHHHLCGTGVDQRAQQQFGADPVVRVSQRGIGAQHTSPLGLKKPGCPGSVDDGQHSAQPIPAPRGDPAGGQRRDPDPTQRAERQPGLDRRAGIIGVDMDGVPAGGGAQCHRITQTRQLPAQPNSTRRIEAGYQVHHLELGRRRSGFVRARPMTGHRLTGHRPAGPVSAALWGVSGNRAGEGVEQDQQPAAAGINHAGLSQYRKLVRSSLKRGRGGLTGDVERLGQTALLIGPDFDRRGRGLQYGDHRAGYQFSTHRRDHQSDRLPQRRAQQGGVHLGKISIGDGRSRGIGQGLQDLRQDDPGVTPGTVKSAPGHGCGEGGDVGIGRRRLGGGQCGAHGEQHVRAGIAVGHREDVQQVDLIGVSE